MISVLNMKKAEYVKHIVRFAVAFVLVFFANNVYAYKVYAFDSKEINLDINASVSAGYDDNIAHESSDQKIYKDYFSKLGLGLGLHLEGKNRSAHLIGNMWHTFYKDLGDFDETAGDVKVAYIDEISRYDTFKFRNLYYQTFKAGSIEDELGRVRGRYKQLTNDLQLSYKRELGPNLSATASYCNVYVKSDVSNDSSIKSYNNSFTLESEYTYSQATSLTSFYEFSKTDYDGIESDIGIHTIAAGLRRFITQQLFVDGLAGVSFVERTIDKMNYSGTGGYIKLLMTSQLKNAQIRLSVEKSMDANVVRDELLDSWRLSGSVTMQLLKRLSSTMVLFYGNGSYDSLDITEELWGSDIGFKYNFTDRLYSNLHYTHSEKDVTEPGDDYNYKRNSFTLGFNIVF
jgi:hypothetical protein